MTAPTADLRTGTLSTTAAPAAGLAGLRREPPAELYGRILGEVGLVDDYAPAAGPVGLLLVAFNKRGVSCVGLGDDEVEFVRAFQARHQRPLRRVGAPPVAVLRALQSPPAARRLAVDLRGLSSFDLDVLAATREIPHGEVRSYSWVAGAIGRGAAVRAVGSALGRNPVPVIVPCHRVVRSDGRIGEYGLGGTDTKRAILSAEGVDVAGLERLAGQGVRLLGSETTGIVCVPTCRDARRIAPSHRVTFTSAAAAAAAGFRPCRRCRPIAAA